jgi:hypothetical protein
MRTTPYSRDRPRHARCLWLAGSYLERNELQDIVISGYHLGTVISPKPDVSERMPRVPISFPDELYEWMRETAFRRRVPMAELVREALREYRDRIDPQLGLWDKEDR